MLELIRSLILHLKYLHPDDSNAHNVMARRTVPRKVSLKLLENPEKVHLKDVYGGTSFRNCKVVRRSPLRIM